jgi:hypothetical protein
MIHRVQKPTIHRVLVPTDEMRFINQYEVALAYVSGALIGRLNAAQEYVSIEIIPPQTGRENSSRRCTPQRPQCPVVLCN